MKTRLFTLALFLSLVTGCYVPISGKVIDAETNAPIEGAVVLVEWTKTKGVGFTYTESYKAAEVISNKDGKVRLPGCFCLFANEPDVTVYKKGYVAWSSRIIFPDYRKRTDFMWGNYNFKLERFKSEYLYDDHTSFISSAINSTIGNKKLIEDAYRWEELEASKERNQRIYK